MPESAKRPFWMHQLVEYILGGAMVAVGLQSPTPVLPAIVGGAILVDAAITKGPVGAFRWIGRRVHRVIDAVLIPLEVVAAVQPWYSIEGGTRIVMLGIALVHALVWWQSSYVEKMRVRKLTAAEVVAAYPDDRSTRMGRSAGRMAGNAVNAVRRSRAKREQ